MSGLPAKRSKELQDWRFDSDAGNGPLAVGKPTKLGDFFQRQKVLHGGCHHASGLPPCNKTRTGMTLRQRKRRESSMATADQNGSVSTSR